MFIVPPHDLQSVTNVSKRQKALRDRHARFRSWVSFSPHCWSKWVKVGPPPGPRTSPTLSSLPDLVDAWLGSRLAVATAFTSRRNPILLATRKTPNGSLGAPGYFPSGGPSHFRPCPLIRMIVDSADANLFLECEKAPQRRSQPSQDRRKFLTSASQNL